MSPRRETNCATPNCPAEPQEGRRFCGEHAQRLAEIREDLENNPRLLYRQRSDNPERVFNDGRKRRPSVPTCCVPGCYEIRIPPTPYCDDHEGFAGGD
jgi:hypothetical protein